MEFAEVFDRRGGFDIAVANPPYVRQEQIGPTKAALTKLYASAATARSDLCCYFYARALQMLRTGGMHVFVCSNSWLVGYVGYEFLLRKVARVPTEEFPCTCRLRERGREAVFHGTDKYNNKYNRKSARQWFTTLPLHFAAGRF